MFTFLSLLLTLCTLNAQINVGDTAPDFTGIDYNGEEHHLYDYLSQGKHVLLKFGFVACAPCHESVWGTNILYHGFGCNEEDLVVLGLDVTNTDAAYDDYFSFWAAQSTTDIGGIPLLSTPHFPEITLTGGSEAINTSYGNLGFPVYFLVSPDHKVIAGGAGSSFFQYLDNSILYWQQTYENFESLGMDPVLTIAGAVNYYADNVAPYIASEDFTETPFSEFCDGGIVANDECDNYIPQNIVATVNDSQVTVNWTADNICDEYYVNIYGSGGPLTAVAQTTTDNSYIFTDISPGEYLVSVYCTCNDTYQTSDPVSVSVAFDEIITDFVSENCSNFCDYELTLSFDDSTAGGAFDWLTHGLFLELQIGDIEGGFWLTANQTEQTWTIEACTDDPISMLIHTDVSGIFLGSAAIFEMKTSEGDVVFNDAMSSFFDQQAPIAGVVEIFTSTVNCSLQPCEPDPIDDIIVINDPINVYTIDWSDQDGCGSYSVRWRDQDNPFPLWINNTVFESEFNIPSGATSLNDTGTIEVQVRCNCPDGGAGEYSDTFIFDYEAVDCTPQPPANLTLENISSTTAEVSWEVTSGEACHLYNLLYREMGTANWTNILSSFPTVTLTNLEPATEYEFQVACGCDFIDSDFSEILIFTTESEEDCDLETPIGLAATVNSQTTVSLLWDESESCIGYTLRYRAVDEMNWSLINAVSHEAEILNLLPQTTYEASVRCICGIGFSPYSQNVEFTTIVNSLNEVEDYTDASVYPNPVTNTLYIKWTGQDNRNLQAEVYNVTGGKMLLFQSDVSAGVKTDNLAGGVYFIRLISEKGIQRTLKFIKYK